MINFYCSEKHDKKKANPQNNTKHGEVHADHEEAHSLRILYVRFAFVLVAVDTGAIELLSLRRKSVLQVALDVSFPQTLSLKRESVQKRNVVLTWSSKQYAHQSKSLPVHKEIRIYWYACGIM